MVLEPNDTSSADSYYYNMNVQLPICSYSADQTQREIEGAALLLAFYVLTCFAVEDVLKHEDSQSGSD